MHMVYSRLEHHKSPIFLVVNISTAVEILPIREGFGHGTCNVIISDASLMR